MGRQVHHADVADNEPAFELVIKQDKAEYLYRFLGSRGDRVHVHKNFAALTADAKPDYVIVHPGVCGCRGFQYRDRCKHSDTAKTCWECWDTCRAIYARAGRRPVAVDIGAVLRALRDAHPVNPPAFLGGSPV